MEGEAYGFFRLLRSRLACCLGVTGFTNPPIGEALVASVAQQVFGAFCIRYLEWAAAVVAEIELGKVAVKVSFAAMLLDADPPRLKTENTFAIVLV